MFAKNVFKIMIGKSVSVNLQVRMFIICNGDQLRESNLECFIYNSKACGKHLTISHIQTKS